MFTAKVFAAALITFCALTQAWAGPNYCDDKIEPGESPDGKIMMMTSMIAKQIMAEEYCGAKPEPLAKTLVVLELAHGCGPRSKLEADAEVKQSQIATPEQRREFLELLSPEINSLPRQEVVKMIEQELGGCSDLLKERQEVLKRYNQ